MALRVQEGAFVMTIEKIKRVNGSIAEIAYEQAVAVGSKVTGRHGNTPRGIEIRPVLNAQKQIPERVKNVDEAQTRAMLFVSGTRHPVRKSDDNVAADVLDAERSVVGGKLRIHKAGVLEAPERSVIYLYAA